MPFFRCSNLHLRDYRVNTSCCFGLPAKVAVTEEALHMSVERNFARQWRLMNSPVFKVLSWVLAWFVPQRKGFGKFRHGTEDDPQAGEQFAAIDSKELLQCSKAIDSPQDPPGEGAEVPEALQNMGSEVGLAKESPSPAEFPELALLLSGGIWAIESIEQTPEVLLDSWQCFELQRLGRPERTRHFAGSNARHWHGQVSSAIVAMDPATRRCTTSSGRVYQLGESNGLAGNGEYTWHQWLRINQATAIVDVTDEIKKMLARSA